MTYIKPCARPGCEGICQSFTPSQHARKRYCTVSCSMRDRVAQGWRPPKHPQSFYQAIGLKGGKQAGIVRRKKAALDAARDLAGMIPEDMELRLGAKDYQRVLVLLTRAWRRGRTAERSANRMRKAA